MKSLNWISGTGRRPYIAMPMAAPTMPASASGVSITRSAPNSSIRPTVARNTPPNLPTSSPRTTTRGSRRISRRSASLTAWMMFHSGIRNPALHEELARLVARPHQRARGDEAEAQREAFLLQLGEDLGPDEFLDREVLLAGAQILAEREDVTACRAQIAHGRDDFVPPLAKAQHDGALGAHSSALVVLEDTQRLHVRRAPVAHSRGQSFHRLDVVRRNGGLGVDDHVERIS